MHLSRDPWSRSPGESEEAYAEFRMWLQAPRPRPAPHRPDLAGTWEWGARAAAHDATPSVKQRTVKENLEAIGRDLPALISLGVTKWLNQELASPEVNRVSLTELMRAYAVYKDLKGVDAALGAGPDVRSMTAEELDTLERASKLLRMKA